MRESVFVFLLMSAPSCMRHSVMTTSPSSHALSRSMYMISPSATIFSRHRQLIPCNWTTALGFITYSSFIYESLRSPSNNVSRDLCAGLPCSPSRSEKSPSRTPPSAALPPHSSRCPTASTPPEIPDGPKLTPLEPTVLTTCEPLNCRMKATILMYLEEHSCVFFVFSYRVDHNRGQYWHHHTRKFLLRDEVKQEAKTPVVNIYNIRQMISIDIHPKIYNK